MKHVVAGQKAVFLNDEAADVLIAYAAHVAQLRIGDSVALRGINSEGNLVVTTFLLNAGTDLVAESTNFSLTDPDNDDAIAYMRTRIEGFRFNPEFFEGFRPEMSDDDPA